MSKWLGLAVLGVAIYSLSYTYNQRFLDWLRFQSLGTRDHIVEKLSMMFIDIPPQRILIGLFAISFGLGSLVFLLFLPQVVPGILFGVAVTIAGWKAPKPLVDWYYRRRVRKLVTQMIDGLALMSNGLKSGLSVVQSMSLVVQEMSDPIREEFRFVLNQNKIGTPLEDALNDLARRNQADDVEMFVTAINILKETGGNLAETFDTITGTIRDRIKVENKIEALTAQGFYQGVLVMMVPPVMAVVLYQSDPEGMTPMFTTPLGWVMVLIVILLEVAGFFLIMRIIKIDI